MGGGAVIGKIQGIPIPANIPGPQGEKGDAGLPGTSFDPSEIIRLDGEIDGVLAGIILGTSDAYGRKQIWNKLTNSIIRLGALQQDGDPEPNMSSEGLVIYGKNLQNDVMYQSNWSYVRLKPNRIGLYNSKLGGYVGYIVKMDTTEDTWYFTDNNGNKTIKFIRSEGKIILSKLSDGTNEVIISDILKKNNISGSFTTVDGKTITVVNGQITNIS